MSEVSPVSHSYALSADWNSGQSTGTTTAAHSSRRAVS